MKEIMKYSDLTLDQRISLKGEFETNPECTNYLLVLRLWDFVTAVEYFLNDDVSVLRRKIFFNSIFNRVYYG